MKNILRIVALVLSFVVFSAAVAPACAPPIEDAKAAPAKAKTKKKAKKAKKAKKKAAKKAKASK